MRSGTLLMALLTDEQLSREARGISKELAKIKADSLWTDLPDIVAGSEEDGGAGWHGPSLPGEPGQAMPRGDGKTPALDQYTVNLTQRARDGKIDPVLGRDGEIRQMVDILIRRRQNNPILTGEAGVGKTAVVEGFARRVAEGDVPDVLKPVDVRTLDLGLLAGRRRRQGRVREPAETGDRGSEGLAEAHHPVYRRSPYHDWRGGAAGQNDAANLLKPALARGELRTIAATTWAEYKKYFEKDAALARRFQVVKVEEPEETKAIVMMRAMADVLEHHHKVRILDEAVSSSRHPVRPLHHGPAAS